jgi:hypothetical protein
MQAPLSHLNPAAQPVVLRSVHVVPHAVAETQDVFPGQGAEVVAAMQVPLPLHCPAGTKVGGAVPEHDGLPHAVPETWSRQAPTPSHVPSRPHGLFASTVHSASGSVPAKIGLQRPSEAPVLAVTQAMQEPGQAFSQQTPSAQAPDTHSVAVEQTTPVDFFPTQVPPEQMLPVRQSASTVQAVLQTVADAQTTPPAQEVADAGAQTPPLQVPLPTKIVPMAWLCAFVWWYSLPDRTWSPARCIGRRPRRCTFRRNRCWCPCM